MEQEGKINYFLKYYPGSPDTVARGCTCPEAENNFGRERSKNGKIEAIMFQKRMDDHRFELPTTVVLEERGKPRGSN